MKRTWVKKILVAAVGFVGTGLVLLTAANAVVPARSNADYNSDPLFVSNTVSPNILFILDLGDKMLPAAYGKYPISALSGTVTAAPAPSTTAKYASNVNLAGTGGKDLVSSSDDGATTNGATVAAPSDTFVSTKAYFGMFDPFRCYTTNSTSFIYAAAKDPSNVSTTCLDTDPGILATPAPITTNGTIYWDGNLLNWLTMRKKDVAYQAFEGGLSLPAGSSNADGTANKLQQENTTGQNGTNNTCSSTASPCWRFVKFVPTTTLLNRVPTVGTKALPVDTVGALQVPPGRFFGDGEATLYVNDDAGADPFDTANANKYNVSVDITTEPDTPPASGAASNCILNDPDYAGNLACYRKARTLGLFQKLRTDVMRAAVMFVNQGSGNGGSMQVQFDDSSPLSSIFNNIRNVHVQTHSPLSEAVYEGLCLYHKYQGPCYTQNTGSSAPGYNSNTGVSGDPYFFVANNQMVGCCKSFILLISPGVADSSGTMPAAANLGDLVTSASSNIGVVLPTVGTATGADQGDRLDDVAFFGHTHDLRPDPPGLTAPSGVTGSQTVAFYAVNAMGGAAGSVLLSSAAKYGGFVDRDSDGQPQAPQASYTCTFKAGSHLGTPGTTSTSSAEWDTNKDCEPDTYFDAGEATDLEATIIAAIEAILKNAASGTSVSVLATSSTGEGALYQAFFFPSRFEGQNEIKWLGYTQGLFIDTFGNLREDTDGDHALVLENDNIIVTRFDTATNDVKVDRFKDDGTAPGSVAGDGIADTTTPFETVSLKDIKPIWEAGARLAYTSAGSSCTSDNAGVSCRRILTWTDTNGDKTVVSSEVIELTVANDAALCPYLAPYPANDPSGNTPLAPNCNSSTASLQTAALAASDQIINFVRGWNGTTENTEVTDTRTRLITVVNPDDGTSAQRIWKLGDIVYSTPTVVGSPKERFDVIYGDSTYTTFFQQYKNRRQVAYVGANDGMIHAFNAGFFTAGDNGATTTTVEHGFFSLSPPSGSGITTTRATPKLGAELWAFVPQELLPHLKWLIDPDYKHVSFMDLKPKVTDVRIFTPDSDHPGGWGTILIAGMRLGGSCGACATGTNNGGPPMQINAPFDTTKNINNPTNTRTFYSAYVVFDITNPEKDPTLLWVITDSTLGLTTSYPSVLRVSPLGDGRTDSTHEKWFAVFGSGPTTYTGASTQVAKFFAVDIAAGPTYTSGGAFSGPAFSTGVLDTTSASCTSGNPVCGSFMGDIITLDANLDFRVDAIYAGTVIKASNGNTRNPSPPTNILTVTGSVLPPAYIGRMYRLTTGALSGTSSDPTDTSNWGVSSAPTVLLASFAKVNTNDCTTPAGVTVCHVGPITAGATVTADDTNNIWVFFGSGRYFGTADKTNTDIQHFYGVKDPCANSADTTFCDQTAQQNDLFNASGIVVCTACSSATNNVSTDTGTTFTQTFDSLLNSVKAKKGWFTTLLPQTASPTPQGERVISTPTVLSGTVFFTTFIPVSSDICVAAGQGNLYALFYQTGSAYKTSTIGTTAAGSQTISLRSMSLGQGLPSQMAVQIGAQGSGAAGSTSSTSGCAGRVTGFIQASTGVLGKVCGTPALSSWSRMVSWRDM